jgi:hypothetical protein
MGVADVVLFTPYDTHARQGVLYTPNTLQLRVLYVGNQHAGSSVIAPTFGTLGYI